MSLNSENRPFLDLPAEMAESAEYLEVIMSFADSLNEQFLELKKEALEGNMENVKQIAHKLKNAATFGFPLVTQVATPLEKSAANKEVPRVLECVNQLLSMRVQVDEAMTALEKLASKQQF